MRLGYPALLPSLCSSKPLARGASHTCLALLPRLAGYKQGNEPLPLPPVTRSVLMFRKPGMSDTGMLQAALAWAHLQPVTDRERCTVWKPDRAAQLSGQSP